VASIEISEPRTEQEFEEYYAIRYERLRKPQGLEQGSERDEALEKASTHLVAKVDGTIAAAASWTMGIDKDAETGGRIVYIWFRNIAVHPDYEALGLGVRLVMHIIETAKQRRVDQLRGNARNDKVRYFERFGFRVLGPGETVNGIEHSLMAGNVKDL
jgi:GNAT superfamily N-acetyltransferase